MNNINFEALRELWLAYGGEPDKELHPEDHGRYVAARMAEARRPDSRLSEFDEWARRERREQEKADDLHGVRGALERIATSLEAGQGEEEQAPKVMQGGWPRPRTDHRRRIRTKAFNRAAQGFVWLRGCLP